METRVDEIADNIFRIGLWTGQAPITFNQFVIRDDCPALIHTGHAALFDTVRSQVARLVDPRTLRYISFSHFEADECGALNHWLDLAPDEYYLSRLVNECHCLPSEAEYEWNHNFGNVLRTFMVHDFMNAIEIYYSTEEKDRPTNWMFDLIKRLDFTEKLGAEAVAKALGES